MLENIICWVAFRSFFQGSMNWPGFKMFVAVKGMQGLLKTIDRNLQKNASYLEKKVL